MPSDIIVCVKQVPHPDYLSKISLDPTRGVIEREGVPAVINPGDRNALEEALRLREKFSGRVIVLTMGPPQARKALEEALAMDADAAIHLCDRAFAGADTLATAQALAYGIRKLEQFNLVLCGGATIDSGTGQVAVQLAEFLDLPCVTDAEELTFEDERSLLVKRIWEQGYIKVRIKLPAVIAVTDRINQPRLPNVLGIMAATRKEIKDWNAGDTGAEVSRVGLSGSPTQVIGMSEFHAKRQGDILQGLPEDVVTLAIDRLVKLGML
ncbi:electron transfer flavoprotein subunit beta/FixA family protein [Chloroflexota bacterium]